MLSAGYFLIAALDAMAACMFIIVLYCCCCCFLNLREKRAFCPLVFSKLRPGSARAERVPESRITRLSRAAGGAEGMGIGPGGTGPLLPRFQN